MTELELLVDFHRDAERQGPGSAQETIRALDLIPHSPASPMQVADIGCGSGAQTLTLAQHIHGHITAVDLFPEFLDTLTARAERMGLEKKIHPLLASMEALPFEEEQWDLIWSEGAIYHMGFEQGVTSWRKFLKPGAYLAVSEVIWLTPSRPPEIEAFWNQAYPEIDTASAKMKVLEESGYTPMGFFVLSPSSWLDNYYRPLEQHAPAFLERHAHSEMARSIVEEHQKERELYEQYHPYYGYGFFVARKY